jgi:hypothetical protein
VGKGSELLETADWGEIDRHLTDAQKAVQSLVSHPQPGRPSLVCWKVCRPVLPATLPIAEAP